jgi:hypothetical protein
MFGKQMRRLLKVGDHCASDNIGDGSSHERVAAAQEDRASLWAETEERNATGPESNSRTRAFTASGLAFGSFVHFITA